MTKNTAETTAETRLPGDLSRTELVARMIRVNHAGEFGAGRIYEGQLALLAHSDIGPTIRHMKEQEDRHLARFETMLVARGVRPTALHPVWNLAGFALGFGTALLGRRAAMACTVAVEQVIDDHYASQAEQLGDDEAELRGTIEECRAEELEHRDVAIDHGGEEALGYPLLRRAIQAASRAAIHLSERF